MSRLSLKPSPSLPADVNDVHSNDSELTVSRSVELTLDNPSD